MSLTIPLEIVEFIAWYIHENPFTFINLSHVSQSFRRYFLSPVMWERLKVTEDDDSSKFIHRMETSSEDLLHELKYQWRAYQSGAKTPSLCRDLLDSPDYALSYCIQSGTIEPRIQQYFSQRAFCWSVLYFSPWHIEHFDRWKQEREFAMEAVRLFPHSLKYIGPPHNIDREIVLMAVSKDGTLLEYAQHFRNDFEICKTAAISDAKARHFMGAPLMVNKEIIMASLHRNQEHNPLMIDYDYQTPLLFDEEVIVKASSFFPTALEMAPHFNNNKTIALNAVMYRGQCLEYVSNELKDDVDVVAMALGNDAAAYQFASKRLQEAFEPAFKLVKEGDLGHRSFTKQQLEDSRRIAAGEP